MPGSRRALQQLRRPKLLAPSFGQRRFSFAVAGPCGWKLDSLERRRYCGFDMKSCRCEHGDWTVGGTDQQFNLSASEDDTFRARLDQAVDRGTASLARALLDDAKAQLVVDDPVDLSTIICTRH
jgi:hypothetical protein